MSATTSLAACAAAICAAVEARGWTRVLTPGTPLSAGEADGTFRALPTGPLALADAFGRGSEQVLIARFSVDVHRLLQGDPQVEEPALLDEARAAGDAIEGATFPDGTEAVVVEDRGVVERGYEDLREACWARVRMTVRVMFTAPYVGA